MIRATWPPISNRIVIPTAQLLSEQFRNTKIKRSTKTTIEQTKTAKKASETSPKFFPEVAISLVEYEF
jgi:hypothetical protein